MVETGSPSGLNGDCTTVPARDDEFVPPDWQFLVVACTALFTSDEKVNVRVEPLEAASARVWALLWLVLVAAACCGIV